MNASPSSRRLVARLAERSERIIDVVHLIEGVAAQTQLLALNASRTAHAGEVGTEEVRQLSDHASAEPRRRFPEPRRHAQGCGAHLSGDPADRQGFPRCHGHPWEGLQPLRQRSRISSRTGPVWPPPPWDCGEGISTTSAEIHSEARDIPEGLSSGGGGPAPPGGQPGIRRHEPCHGILLGEVSRFRTGTGEVESVIGLRSLAGRDAGPDPELAEWGIQVFDRDDQARTRTDPQKFTTRARWSSSGNCSRSSMRLGRSSARSTRWPSTSTATFPSTTPASPNPDRGSQGGPAAEPTPADLRHRRDREAPLPEHRALPPADLHAGHGGDPQRPVPAHRHSGSTLGRLHQWLQSRTIHARLSQPARFSWKASGSAGRLDPSAPRLAWSSRSRAIHSLWIGPAGQSRESFRQGFPCARWTRHSISRRRRPAGTRSGRLPGLSRPLPRAGRSPGPSSYRRRTSPATCTWASKPWARLKRVSTSWSVFTRAWPMCRLPVMLGGGMTMDQGSLPLVGAASKALEASTPEYQRVCAVLKSNALSISRMGILGGAGSFPGSDRLGRSRVSEWPGIWTTKPALVPKDPVYLWNQTPSS